MPHDRPTKGTPSLETWAKGWKTPRASDGEKGGPNQRGSSGDLMLPSQAVKWATPQARDVKGCDVPNRVGTPSLGHPVERGLWSTPRTITGGGESAERKRELGRTASGGGDLQAQSENWPTPAVADTQGGRKARSGTRAGEPLLNGIAANWPTATAGDAKSTGAASYSTESGRHSGTTLTDAVRGHQAPPTETPGPESRPKLNPRFVEWLMGFPAGWTDSAPLGTAWCRWSRRMRSELSRLAPSGRTEQ